MRGPGRLEYPLTLTLSPNLEAKTVQLYDVGTNEFWGRADKRKSTPAIQPSNNAKCELDNRILAGPTIRGTGNNAAAQVAFSPQRCINGNRPFAARARLRWGTGRGREGC